MQRQASNNPINKGDVAELSSSDQSPELSEESSLGSALAWVIWAISAIFVLFQFSIQLTSGVIVEGLMRSFSLTAFGGGLLASTYYYVYVVLQAPAGFLVDHYGTRRILSIGAAICGLGCVLFAVAPNVAVALLGRLLMGAGASFAFVGSMNLVIRWFPVRRFGFMAAIAETIGMIGSLVGGYFLAHIVQDFGWRFSMESAAGLALVIAFLLALIVRNAPKNEAPRIPRTRAGLWGEIKSLLKKPVVWLNGLYSSAIFGIITIFVALWGVPFMQKLHHLSLSRATLLCNLVFIGVVVGAPLLGWLDNHLRSRRMLMVSAAFGACAILCLLIFDQWLSVGVAAGLMLLLGVLSSVYVVTFIIANEVATRNTRSTSIGLTNMLSVASAPIIQPLIGLILYLLSNHHHHQTNFDAYSIGHFQLALSVIPLFVGLAAIVGFWLPNRKKS